MVTFPDGDTATKTVNVPITDDQTYEGDETVTLCLSGTTINVVGCSGANATLTIVENDVPNISARDARVAEPDVRHYADVLYGKSQRGSGGSGERQLRDGR